MRDSVFQSLKPENPQEIAYDSHLFAIGIKWY